MQNMNDRIALSSIVSAISRAKVEYKLNIIVDYSFASDIMNMYRNYFAGHKDIQYSLFDDLGIFRSLLNNELVSNSLGLLVTRISCICDLPDDNYYDYIEKNKRAAKYADDCYALLLKFLKIVKEEKEEELENLVIFDEKQKPETVEIEVVEKPLEDISMGRPLIKTLKRKNSEVIYSCSEGKAIRKF